MGDDPIRSGIGRAVRAARTDAGLSMRALADACAVSQPFISAIEHGQSTPSIATLYRLAGVLGVEPSSLLPVREADEISVIRADEGERVPSSDRPGSAVGRVVLSDERRHLEVYDYVVEPDDDLEVWYEHPGEVVLLLRAGTLIVDLRGHESVELHAGDCLVHPGSIAHRWTLGGDAPVHIFLVITRQGT
ncbi:MAG: XRE family transcriptional regulator [Actinomycetota bacterium]